MSKCTLGYRTVNERVLLVKLHGRPFKISIIVVYELTIDNTKEETDAFYENFERLMKFTST